MRGTDGGGEGGGRRGGGGGEVFKNLEIARPCDPTCKDRRDREATARTINVKEAGTPPVLCNLLFQQLCRTESQRQSPMEQLLEPEAKRQSNSL